MILAMVNVFVEGINHNNNDDDNQTIKAHFNIENKLHIKEYVFNVITTS